MRRNDSMRMMMIKIRIIFGLICTCLLCGCGEIEGTQEPDFESEEERKAFMESEEIAAPDISQIRAICELATLECYYHNVAVSIKEKGTGLLHLGEKDRQFWIEYSGSAKLGINMSKVGMKAEGTQIEITMPKAELLGMTDYVFEEENYISEDDGFNKNPITADNQTEAVAAAEEEVKRKFSSDEALLAQAQDRAKKLIENYIHQLGELTETNYQIKWVYEGNASENGDSTESTKEAELEEMKQEEQDLKGQNAGN